MRFGNSWGCKLRFVGMSTRTLLFTDCVDFVGSACKSFAGMKKYVSTGAVDVDHINDSDTEIVDYDGKPSRANLVVMAGDVLFAKMQGTKKTLLIDSVLAKHIYSTGFCAVRAKKAILTERCLYHILTSEMFLSQKDKNCSGATQIAITNAGLGKIVIHVPSVEEQNNIADQLDAVICIITKRQQELSALDILIKARFVDMFGDPDTNPMGWTEHPLSEMLSVLGGYAFKSEGFSEVDGIPVLRIGNINAGFFKPVNMVFWEENESLERYIMYPGDLVMSLTGTVGKDDYGNVCILGNDYDKYYLNQRNAKLELKEGLDKHYLSQMLRFEKIKKRLTGISRGVRQANISNKDILNLSVPIPPVDLQLQYAAFVAQVDKSKVAVQKALDEAQVLFDSLMQQYFG